jgi:hypothetical protein
MRNVCGWIIGCAVLCGAAAVRAEEPRRSPRDAQELAGRIDAHLARAWQQNAVQPAPAADDAEWLRRVYLDLAGRIPSVAETREFLNDNRPDKRQRTVDKLLTGPRYVSHFARYWRTLLVPEANQNLQAQGAVGGVEAWMTMHLRANTPYDRIVHELLTVPVAGGGRQPGLGVPGQGGNSPAGFYVAKELLPENVADATARLFLGVRLGCAQCHDHPFAQWKRDQFWSYAAFFGGIRRQRQGDFVQPLPEEMNKHEIAIPGTNRTAVAKFLDGSKPEWKQGDNAREVLANWLTAPENPYFARATVNRIWAYFHGSGLVDPIDEMVGTEAVPSHPELLDELARSFVEHKYDLKFLIKAITLSKAYGLSSRRTHKSQDDATAFARMPLRGLTGEQLWDSLVQATGYRDNGNQQVRGFGGPAGGRGEFLARFANSNEKPTETTTSILQALTLMNGRVITDSTSLERSETLAALLDAPFLDTRGRIEALYLAALTRKPTEKELSRAERYIAEREAEAEAKTDRETRYRHALADVLWALLNSSEFYLNH